MTMPITMPDLSVRPFQLVAVRFKPGGAVPFLRLSADALTDTECLCADIGASRLVPPGLEELDDLAAIVRRLEQRLLAKLADVTHPDRRVQYAVDAICAASPPSVDALARDMGWSRQHLARTIRANVGIGPKQLARTARMHRAVALLQRQPCPELADVAAATGYFDQAHMANDFRELVGAPPGHVQASRGSIFTIPAMVERA